MIHTPKNLRTSGLLLASVSHTMCSAADVSLVPLPIPTTQPPITSLCAALLGAGDVKRWAAETQGCWGAWHPAFSSPAFPCGAQTCITLRSRNKMGLEPSQHPVMVLFCAVTPCRAYLGMGKCLLNAYNVGRTSCILTWTSCSRWAVNPASQVLHFFKCFSYISFS